MVIKVWVQLLRGGENIGTPDQIKLEDDDSNVADLRKAVKVEFEADLNGISAARLNVSTARESTEYLSPAQKLQKLPARTEVDTPLFVHAPALAGGSEQERSKKQRTDNPEDTFDLASMLRELQEKIRESQEATRQQVQEIRQSQEDTVQEIRQSQEEIRQSQEATRQALASLSVKDSTRMIIDEMDKAQQRTAQIQSTFPAPAGWSDGGFAIFARWFEQHAEPLAGWVAIREGRSPASEADVQELFTCIHQFFFQLQTQTSQVGCSTRTRSWIDGWDGALSSILPRDTHASYAPLQPQCKFDYTFVPRGSASAGEHVQVEWEDVAMVVELKQSLAKEEQRKAVLVQLSDDVVQLFEKQPTREFAVGIASDARHLQVYRCCKSGEKTKTDKLPMLLTTEANGLKRTDGLDLYIGLMHATEQDLGYFRPQPPHLPPSFRGPALKSIVRRRHGTRPEVLRLKDDTVLKVHFVRAMFENEREVFSLLQPPVPVLKMKAFDAEAMWLHLDTYCPYTLDDILFSSTLFDRVCRSAAAVLRVLWGCGLAYMDPKPTNVLLTSDDDNATIYWNDFGISQQLGLQMSEFQGSREYSSLRVNELDTELAKKQNRSVVYGREDDAQAVFFTLLSFALSSTGERNRCKLPWHVNASLFGSGMSASEIVYHRKKQWVEQPNPVQHLTEVVLPHVRSLLCIIHEMLFKSPSSEFDWEAFCKALEQ